jgi:hypothetical protein
VNNAEVADKLYDWDPRDVSDDQVQAYDALRARCPVAHSEAHGWSLLRHADALAALTDPATFSSRVSAHVAVPNGMDGAEHAAFRAVVDRCFTPQRVAAFAPELRGIAGGLVAGIAAEDGPVEVMTALGEPYAALAQCAYLGWPAEVADALREWSADSQRATRARDRAELDRVAARFDQIIVAELDSARVNASPRTLTHVLLAEQVDGRALTDGELVSIVRNWTAGELGTISAAVGIIVEFLARRPDVQDLVRTQPGLRQPAMDEMLRLEAPLISNRRRTTRPVPVGGRTIPAEAPVSILWPAVQRDPDVFDDPTAFRLDRDPADNLLYGRGPHYCPGEGLSRLELGILLDALLDALPPFLLAGEPVRASAPAGGFVEVRIERTQAASTTPAQRQPW